MSIAETGSEPCQTFKMEIFPKIVNGYKHLTIVAKSYILGILHGSEYVPSKVYILWKILQNPITAKNSI